MKKTCKTFLRFLLAFSFVLSVIPAMSVSVSAAEYTSWDELQNAISKGDKTEFILTQDITAPDSVSAPLQIRGKNIVLDLNGHTLSRNRSSALGTGQVIVVHKGADLTVKDSSGVNAGRITGGWAQYNGAGIYVYGTLIFESGTVTGNKCGEKGAGIFLNGGSATVKGGVIDNNTGAQFGGGIYCGENSSLTMTGGIIRNNSASKNGGALYLGNGANVRIEKKVNIICNKAGDKGAAAYLEKGSSFYASELTLFNNTAPGKTGYDYESYANSFYREDTSALRSFVVLAPTIRKDTLYTSWSQLKNDIESGKAKNVILSQDLVASSSDKEIIITDTRVVTIDLNGFSLNRNMSKAVDRGGVLRVEANSKLIVTDSSGNNSGKITGGYSVNGGGICNHGELEFKGGTIAGNRASKDGGGILTRNYGGFNAGMKITGGILKENNANYGGGIYVDGDCKAVIDKMTVAGNSAGTDGGGIYGHEKSDLYIKNCVVKGNTAKYGGGIYFKRATAVITNCVITGNSASGHVGGLYNNYYSVCAVKDSEFSNNISPEKAGAIINNNNSELIISGTVLKNNTAGTDGGALYVHSSAKPVYMSGCTFEQNKAAWGAGIYILEGASAYAVKSDFIENSASQNGGAVWVGSSDNSLGEFRECAFTGNSAAQNGGGIYAQGKGKVTLLTCEMQGQHADFGKGGAIYAGDKDTASVGLADVKITGNRAKSGGGAIYANKAVVSLKGLCNIYENTCDGNGGNVMLGKESYIANPGLYKGSEIYVYAESKTVAKEISEYQTRYLKIENVKTVSFNPEKTVDTPVIASLFSSGKVMCFIFPAAVLIAVAAAIIIKRKNSKAGGAEDDSE